MASSRIKGITIEIGGDTTGLQKALKGVDSQLSNTKSQLKDVERLLKLDPKNTELLEQKQKLLKQAIAETGDRLKTLHDAEKQLKDSGVDENSEQFQALRREIISTEQNMDSLQKESAETDKQLSSTAKAAEVAKKGFSAIGEAAKVGAEALAGMTAAAVAAAAAVTKALASMTAAGGKYADTINTQSAVTGISTERLQELAYAAELVDVSVDTITSSMTKNIRAMQSAANGTESYAEVYEQLGVSVTDAEGNLRDGEDVYWEVIEALGKMENETERDALAMQLLGRSAQDLNPLIKAGSDKMDQFAKEAHDAGYVLSNETLDAYQEFDDASQRLSKGAEAAKNALGTILLPAMTELAGDGVDALGQFTNGILAANGDIEQMGVVIQDTIPIILNSILSFVPNFIALVGSILEAVAHAILENLPTIIRAAFQLLMDVVGWILNNLDFIIQTAVEIIMALADGLIDALPILIPAVMDVIITICEKLTDPDTVMDLIEAAFQIMGALVEGLIKALPRMVEGIKKIAKNMIDLFKKIDWSGIWDGIVEKAKEVWNGIKGVFSKVGDFFADVFGGAWKKVVGVFSTAGEIFTNIKDAVLGGFKKIVNGLISGINKVVAIPFNGINDVLNWLRDVSIFGWTPFENIGTIKVPQIPMLAKGGVLSSGSAIVGEAGPELLTMQNGKAVVQPLTSSHTFSAPFTINVYGSSGQDVSSLADMVADRIQTYIDRKEAAFA